jgi:hypothetical protein
VHQKLFYRWAILGNLALRRDDCVFDKAISPYQTVTALASAVVSFLYHILC